ncbi:MAG: hypothetical protein IPI60_20310 [Saprospiraceae bacterium]|nr:hypothetical protein [Saprospiraceae bacterium]
MDFPEDKKADMMAGAELLCAFCTDIISSGIYEGKKIWTEKLTYLSERLVDLKMGSLGRQIRLFLQDFDKEDSGWVELLLEQIGIWHLCGLHLKRILSKEIPDENESSWLIWGGWTISKEHLENLPITDDNWIVMGIVREKIEQLQSVRTWFYGEQNKRWAQHLEYLPTFQKTGFTWAVGKKYSAAMIFYPGVNNFRVKVKELRSESFATWPEAGDSLDNLSSIAGNLLAKTPFLLNYPILIHSVHLRKAGKIIRIADRSGKYISVHSATTIKPEWLLLSLDRELSIFGEWERGGLKILSIGYRAEFYN